MANTNTTVRPATIDDAEELIAVLAAAFHEGPVACWLVPDTGARHAVYHRYFTDAVDHGLAHGHVDTTADLSAVAIWYPRLEPSKGMPAERQPTLERLAGSCAPRFWLLESMFDTFHPQTPHHYLAYVAVRPERQNQGLGAALLSHYHRRLDDRDLPAYLEATNTRNRDLYRRLGYVAGPPLLLPGDDIPIWRMWRGTRTTTGRSPFPAGDRRARLADGFPRR
ncbi:GNAT family N-acetyltransferase [Salinispora pacifica]|uniref:GNAT family N-acetyltransferase n=1 Tax=Salinispora pacifica TaxID=351187 RepID=UPI0004839EED|nr:GNAT family N-acetyltransferase [Salinispora pacifica]